MYGGGRIGLMGQMADAALQAGGKVIGVIPRSLQEREVAHTGLTKLLVTETMHERKAAMADLAQAFMAMPGGFGTLDELFEIITWAQLGIHTRPIGLFNGDGFFTPLLAWLDQAVIGQGFANPAQARQLFRVGDCLESLLDDLASSRESLSPPADPTGPDAR